MCKRIRTRTRTWRAAIALLAAAALLSPLAATAQQKGARGKKGRTLSFEEDVIESQYLRPQGENVQGINKKKRQSLIRVRTDFYSEIVRSAQDL